jgi:hypothetical protein
MFRGKPAKPGGSLQSGGCLLRWDREHLRGGSLGVDLATSYLPWPTRRTPGACTWMPRLPLLPFFLSPGRPSLSSPLVTLSLSWLTVAGACHLAPPFYAPPRFSEVLRRSPSPSSTSPFKESSRGDRNRRHRRGYLAGNELLRRRNSSTPAILRLRRPPRRVPGELSVLLDPSPLLLPRRSVVSVVTGGSPPWPWLPWPLCHRGLRVGLGPHRSVAVGHLDPGAKSSVTWFYFQKISEFIWILLNS